MSRRNYKVEQSYIDWLKSLGCISYCPFNEDLDDKISGASYEYTGNGSYSFADGWMTVTTPSTSIATTLQITIPNFQNLLRPEMSVLGEVINLGIGKCRPSLFSNVAINSEAAPQWYGNYCRTGTDALSLGIVHKAGRILSFKDRTLYHYLDGSLELTSTLDYDLSQMPSPQNKGMVVGCTGHNNYRNCTFKIRNLMVFNKALDLATIRKIQGYDN